MAKSRAFEEMLDRLGHIRRHPDEHDLAHELPPFLRHKSGHIVGKAAVVVRENATVALTGELVQAFRRLLDSPSERDPGCAAMQEIVETLLALDAPVAEVYHLGLRHVQMEWGIPEPVDVAARLRGLCALALVQMDAPDALLTILPLLTDRWVSARSGAVRAIGNAGGAEAELLLRLHLLRGERDTEAAGEAFAALLRVSPRRSVPYVAGHLDSSSEGMAEAAALALGESRLAEALPVLVTALQAGPEREMRRSLLLAVAMLRREEAVDLLLKWVADQRPEPAADAIAALGLYRHDDEVSRRVQAVVEGRSERVVQEAWRREWRG